MLTFSVNYLKQWKKSHHARHILLCQNFMNEYIKGGGQFGVMVKVSYSSQETILHFI